MKRMAAAIIVVLALVTAGPGNAGASVPGKEFTETGCEQYSDSVARLYTAGLGRQPERGGFEFWMTEYTAGHRNLPQMASFFTQSDEFNKSYGALSQDGFVRQLYRNVLGREGESGGVAFWNGQMSLGMDRGTVLLRFAESRENIASSGTTEPALGPFNVGLPGPWTCIPVAPLGPVQPAPEPAPPAPLPVAPVPEPVAPAPDPVPPTPEPIVPTPPPEEPPPPLTNPGDSKNCSDFSTHAQAQAWFDKYFAAFGDVARLDADKDGRACESLP